MLETLRNIIGTIALRILPLVILASVCGCQRKESQDTLVVYSAGPRELAEWMCDEFEKKYSVETKLFSATTGEVMAKLQAEQANPSADVVILASTTAAEALKESGDLAPLPNLDGVPTRKDWTDPGGFYTGTSASALGIAVREDHAADFQDWEDVYSGKIKGAVIMPSPSQSGTSAEFITAAQVAEGERFWVSLKAAKANGLQVSGPNSQALTSLILGSHVAVLAAADYLVFKQIEKGQPLAMIFPKSGCPVIPRPIAILKTSHAPALAGDFVRFCFSAPAQERMAAEHLIPADPKIPQSPYRPDASKLTALPMNPAEAVKIQADVLRRFRKEIEQSGPSYR